MVFANTENHLQKVRNIAQRYLSDRFCCQGGFRVVLPTIVCDYLAMCKVVLRIALLVLQPVHFDTNPARASPNKDPLSTRVKPQNERTEPIYLSSLPYLLQEPALRG
jgi:hypothetical protein